MCNFWLVFTRVLEEAARGNHRIGRGWAADNEDSEPSKGVRALVQGRSASHLQDRRAHHHLASPAQRGNHPSRSQASAPDLQQPACIQSSEAKRKSAHAHCKLREGSVARIDRIILHGKRRRWTSGRTSSREQGSSRARVALLVQHQLRISA
eukprot:2252375-Pleurochrysis_carterae.AAC.2